MPPPTPSRAAICPHRVRSIQGQTFGFIPHRFLRDGFLCSLTPTELQLYVFLVLVADRSGLSFYGHERICSVLELCLDDFLEARNGLIRKDLVAFDGHRMQVLSLPEKPVTKPSAAMHAEHDLEQHDPATVRQMLQASLAQADWTRRK